MIPNMTGKNGYELLHPSLGIQVVPANLWGKRKREEGGGMWGGGGVGGGEGGVKGGGGEGEREREKIGNTFQHNAQLYFTAAIVMGCLSTICGFPRVERAGKGREPREDLMTFLLGLGCQAYCLVMRWLLSPHLGETWQKLDGGGWGAGGGTGGGREGGGGMEGERRFGSRLPGQATAFVIPRFFCWAWHFL